MTTTTATALPVRDAWASYLRHLRAEGRAPGTLQVYGQALTSWEHFRDARGWPDDVTEVTRPRLEEWLADELAMHSATTAGNYLRSLKAFFTWLVDEDELERSPAARIKSPRALITPPPVLSDDDLTALLRTCRGKAFIDRRDAALLWLLVDTGMRAGEVCNLTLDDIDLNLQVVRVAAATSKTRRGRTAPFGVKTSAALDRYLRVRGSHAYARDPHVFLGTRGPITGTGLYQIIGARARTAGLDRKVWPHLFRHTMAHRWLAAGGGEFDLQQIAGWSDGSQLRRYGASAASERARDAHRRLSPADSLRV